MGMLRIIGRLITYGLYALALWFCAYKGTIEVLEKLQLVPLLIPDVAKSVAGVLAIVPVSLVIYDIGKFLNKAFGGWEQ